MRGVFFVLGAAGGVGAIIANGKDGDELFPKSSAATICSNARSLLASQATHFACTTWPLEKMSQWGLPSAYSSCESATQCEHVSSRPEAAMQTAVPASCCAKTRVERAAFARAVDVDSCGRFEMKSDICDGDGNFLRLRFRVAKSCLVRPVHFEVSLPEIAWIGGVGFCLSWYRASDSTTSDSSLRECERRTRCVILYVFSVS